MNESNKRPSHGLSERDDFGPVVEGYLRHEFLRGREEVENSFEFAASLRDQIENSQPAPVASPRGRSSLREASIAGLTACAVLFLLASGIGIMDLNPSDSDRLFASRLRMADQVDVVSAPVPATTDDSLETAGCQAPDDTHRGVELVSMGIGKTIGSMKKPHQLVSRWLQRSLPPSAVGQETERRPESDVSQVSHELGDSEGQIFVSIASNILGH